MKRWFRVLCGMGLLLGLGSSAKAWTIGLEVAEQTDTALVVGIYFDPQEESHTLSFYDMFFLYDTNVLAWTGEYTNAPPDPLIGDLFASMTEFPGPGSLWDFNGGVFSGGAIINEKTTLGTLSFDVLPGGLAIALAGPAADSFFDVFFDLDNPNFILNVDNSDYVGEQIPADDGGNVPEPSTLLMALSGLGLLGAVRRRTNG